MEGVVGNFHSITHPSICAHSPALYQPSRKTHWNLADDHVLNVKSFLAAPAFLPFFAKNSDGFTLSTDLNWKGVRCFELYNELIVEVRERGEEG